MRRAACLGDDIAGWFAGQVELEQPEGLASFGDGGQDRPGRAGIGWQDTHLLAAERLREGPPSNGRTVARSSLSCRTPPAGAPPSVKCWSRTRARPDRSTIRNDTEVAPSATPRSA